MTIGDRWSADARSRLRLGLMAKRGLDITLALIGLLALTPVMAVVALAIASSMGSPILFRQRRTGHRGQVFTLIKVRTMHETFDHASRSLPDDQRLTRLGHFLRRTSLDEVPQLWNVVRGELSLVGPRPLLPEYLPLYTPEQARRHEAQPGMTGWAQVNGRNALTWEERFALDVWYVEHWSLWLDLRILLKTIRLVITGRGIAAGGVATMRPFTGTNGHQPAASLQAVLAETERLADEPSTIPRPG